MNSHIKYCAHWACNFDNELLKGKLTKIVQITLTNLKYGKILLWSVIALQEMSDSDRDDLINIPIKFR